ncbi:MAG: gamma-glutamylcyclotransferase [Akkermansiaceae bacterium]
MRMVGVHDLESPLLFVYGTLMSQTEGEMANLLADNATKIGDGFYQGKMFRVSRPDGSLIYPAVIASDDLSDRVTGEIFSLSSLNILELLDEYEGCGENSVRPHEYERQIVNVSLCEAGHLEAFIYMYALPTTGLETITSGSFRDHLADNSR